ncbi:hypothetical protein F7P69_00740 [Cellulosimicrobium funkei]|nr:hypothetical protein [Cellulosimicrobium funkei]
MENQANDVNEAWSVLDEAAGPYATYYRHGLAASRAAYVEAVRSAQRQGRDPVMAVLGIDDWPVGLDWGEGTLPIFDCPEVDGFHIGVRSTSKLIKEHAELFVEQVGK